MKNWCIILGLNSFKIINNKHIKPINITQVVKMNLSYGTAVELSQSLNEVLDRSK